MMPCRIIETPFGRWIIGHPTDNTLAWSGARWVPVSPGQLMPIDVQVCNYMSAFEAIANAEERGFTVISASHYY